MIVRTLFTPRDLARASPPISGHFSALSARWRFLKFSHWPTSRWGVSRRKDASRGAGRKTLEKGYPAHVVYRKCFIHGPRLIYIEIITSWHFFKLTFVRPNIPTTFVGYLTLRYFPNDACIWRLSLIFLFGKATFEQFARINIIFLANFSSMIHLIVNRTDFLSDVTSSINSTCLSLQIGFHELENCVFFYIAL